MSVSDVLPYIEIAPPGTASHSVIWLHGLGADGHDFEVIVPELGLPANHGIRFIFPHAPRMPVTINGGYVMRAWYDIVNPDLCQHADEHGIRQSARSLQVLIAHEIERGITSEHIVLAGFSQGGVIALHTGLRHTQTLGGILALSTYVALADTLASERHTANAHTPVFMAHGREDPVIPLQQGRDSRDVLLATGYDVEWHDYPMQHAVCGEEIAHISAWLQRVCR